MSKTEAQNIIMGLALGYECGDPEYEALGMAWDALENNTGWIVYLDATGGEHYQEEDD